MMTATGLLSAVFLMIAAHVEHWLWAWARYAPDMLTGMMIAAAFGGVLVYVIVDSLRDMYHDAEDAGNDAV